jgi:imidazoleglycerol-phosphate dehydratase/histidinol-phosphatase
MAEALVFIERDGGLLARPESDAGQTPPVRLQPGCIEALQRFGAAGFGLVLLIDPAAVDQAAAEVRGEPLQAFLEALLASQDIRFDAVQSCCHAGHESCDCALPGIGLVAGYVADTDLDRRRSIVVGDGEPCVALARAMGLSGYALDGAGSWSEVAHKVLDQPRRARVRRRTRETDISVEVDLDRASAPVVSTGIGFFDHMLEQLGKHGGFELRLTCRGDLEVDEHHTVEDVALALGQALKDALGDKRGIGRYGFVLPMDEAEAQVAIDLSGRAYAVFDGEFPREAVGGLPTELVGHFFRSLGESLGAAVHISVRGKNAHHMIEACFKGVARALRQAIARTGSDLPSTKGTL